jgi:hypothetical protein
MASARKNFAYSTVLTAPSPATSGTSVVVQSGDGAKFPAVPFPVTIWPAGVQPISTNAEIATVTAISTDTFTITRTQEGSTNRSVVVGDQIANAMTAVIDDGWQGINDSWSYASATTITVPSGAASLYQIGDRIKITQTTVKYFYIISLTDTVLTVSGGSDYTVANAAISAIYVSHQSNPIGFPGNFNFSPARAVSGGTVPTYTTIDLSYFRMEGTMVYVCFSWVNLSGGTAGAGTNPLTFSLPVAVKSSDYYGDRNHLGVGWGLNSSTGTVLTLAGGSSAAFGEIITMTGNVTYKGVDQNNAGRTINCQLQYRCA